MYGKKGKLGDKQYDLRTLSREERIKVSYDGTAKDPLKGVEVQKPGPMPRLSNFHFRGYHVRSWHHGLGDDHIRLVGL
jgi:hypothetical protein